MAAQSTWESGDDLTLVIETTQISGYGRGFWSLERADRFAQCQMAKLDITP